MRGIDNHRRRAKLLLASLSDPPATRHLLGARAWRWLRDAELELRGRLNFAGEHRFVDRSTGAEQLLLVVAGYKPYLWPHTLPRLRRYVPEEIDVCVVVPGVHSPELEALAAEAGWSYLQTTENALALAQNLAIAHHPRAEWLHKVDEDILIAEGHFERMLDGYRRVVADGRVLPGFCAPTLNVNGFSYRLFLEALGLEQAYLERFGELRQAAAGVRAHYDGDAALWLWRHSLPLDAVAREIAGRPFGYSTVPVRFSIGAILLSRKLWQEIGGFRVAPRGGLGVEEKDLCSECLLLSRPAVVLHDVFAGHFSFGPQDDVMRPALAELVGGLAFEADPAGAG
jgi:hypothetical protein